MSTPGVSERLKDIVSIFAVRYTLNHSINYNPVYFLYVNLKELKMFAFE